MFHAQFTEPVAMLTLPEIEKVVDGLTVEQKRELHRYLEESLRPPSAAPRQARAHAVTDIPTVELGQVLRLPGADDDLLGEMLEDRR